MTYNELKPRSIAVDKELPSLHNYNMYIQYKYDMYYFLRIIVNNKNKTKNSNTTCNTNFKDNNNNYNKCKLCIKNDNGSSLLLFNRYGVPLMKAVHWNYNLLGKHILV